VEETRHATYGPHRNLAPLIDLHCHILYGIDDGPETEAGSVELARVAARAGIKTIIATPHVSRRYRNDSATIGRLVAQINASLSTHGIPVKVLAGAEIASPQAAELSRDEVSNLTLGGGCWVLLEPPFTTLLNDFDRVAHSLIQAGHRVIIAHPERCPGFHRDVAVLRRLVAAGAASSITASSLTGRFGKPARKLGLMLINDELAHNVASDAHDELMRPPGLAAEIASAGLSDLTEWLTELVPSAILAGQDIPPRPALAARQSRGRLTARFRRAT
jgi:protein-tyrosine phosphatase